MGPRRFRILVAAEGLLALALALVRIGRMSLWFDEAFTAMATNRSLGDTLHVARNRDPNMVGYHVVLWLWRVPFGGSEAALRSLSAVGLAAAVVVLALLGRRLHGDAVGLLAGLLFAVAPFGVAMGQEARSYGVFLLTVTLATWLFVVLVDDGPRWTGAAYAVVAAVACTVQVMAVLVVAAHALSLLVHDRDAVPWRRLRRSALGFVVLVLPLGVLFLVAPSDQIRWIPDLSVHQVRVAITALAGNSVLLLGFGIVVLYAAWCFVIVVRTSGRGTDAWRAALGLAWVVVPVVGTLVVSVAARPLFVDRYMVAVVPALALVTAWALVRVPVRAVAVVVAVGLVGGSLWKTIDHYSAPKDDYRGVVAYLTANATPRDGFVMCPPENRAAVEYYMADAPEARRPRSLSPDAGWSTALARGAPSAARFASADDAVDHLWVVRTHVTDPCRVDVARGRHLALTRDFSSITLERYDR